MQSAIHRWAHCLGEHPEGEWPGYDREVLRIYLPDWHHRAWLDHELEAEEGEGDWALAGGKLDL